MKYAIVNQPFDGVLPPGQNSTGIVTYEIASRMADEFEMIVYAGAKDNRPSRQRVNNVDYRFIPHGRDEWVMKILRRLPGRREDWPPFASRYYYGQFITQVARDLARERCDIIHVYNFSQFVPVVAKFNPGAKIILHMHCDWASQLNPRFNGPRLQRCDMIAGCGGHVISEAQRVHPDIAQRCFTVHNGVDLDGITPSQPAADDRLPVRILSVGRLSPEKGLHVLIEAFGRVVERFSDVELNIVGGHGSAPFEFIVPISDDPKVRDLARFYHSGERHPFSKFLERQVQELALDEKVNFAGSMPHAEVGNAYREADIFVLPSVWHEPFGIPVVEAMAYGLPVVATNGGGPVDIIDPDATGLLVERGDVDSLAAALGRLVDDRALRARIGEAACGSIAGRFTWEKMADAFVSHAHRLCGKD